MVKKSQFTNQEISDLLRSVAAAYTLQNGNRFKIIAYEKAADSVEHLSRELYDLWQERKMNLIPGIGSSLQSSLDEYFQKGRSEHFEKVIGVIPAPVFPLMKVPSIGPKTAFKLVKALNLEKTNSIFEEIEKAAEKGLIAKIPTFGAKSQQEILDAIKRYKTSKNQETRMPLPYAHRMALEIISYLEQLPNVLQIDALGSLRRMSATIGDIDIAVAVKDGDIGDIVKHFLEYPKKITIDNAGEEKASIILPPNIRVDLRVQDISNYGSMLQYFTGNKAHNIKLREYAIKKGYSLSEHGIKDMKTEKTKKYKDEESFYNFLGFQYVPPELRDGSDELEIAARHKIPQLVELQDIKGDMHTHSSYDLKPSHDFGANTYEQMVNQAEKLEYEYIGFADHNPKMSVLTKEEIITIMKKRKEYIESFFKNSTSKVRPFISLETDITPSGELALPEEAIEFVDYLVVSVHSSFQMNREDMTKRVLKALSYPKVKLLGHPTGRLLGKRNGYELYWDKIFQYASSKSIALEINSWPDRLDLPDILVKEARAIGVKFMINSDAHAVTDMLNLRYGISVARRGWATKNDIINTMPYNEFNEWLLLLI